MFIKRLYMPNLSSESKQKECSAVGQHAGHICELESEQDWEALALVTSKPTVRCQNCEAQANSSSYVCMPEDL
jgi:hypothetical protein